MNVHDCTLHIHKSCPATCVLTYLSRVTKSTSPFKYVVPEKNMFIINEYWRMYYVLGILCIYLCTYIVCRKTEIQDRHAKFIRIRWVLISKVLLLKCLWRIQDKHKCQQWQLRQKIVCESLKLCTTVYIPNLLTCTHSRKGTHLSSRFFFALSCLYCRLYFCYVPLLD